MSDPIKIPRVLSLTPEEENAVSAFCKFIAERIGQERRNNPRFLISVKELQDQYPERLLNKGIVNRIHQHLLTSQIFVQIEFNKKNEFAGFWIY